VIVSEVRALTAWRFAENPQDGEAWLKNPTVFQAYVDYQARDSSGRVQWRRVMVVTKAWLEEKLARVRKGENGPLWAAIPPMLILPDAEGEELRRAVDVVVQQGSFDQYGTALDDPDGS
jgi:hypothetical protein